jgi:hypothetical protein
VDPLFLQMLEAAMNYMLDGKQFFLNFDIEEYAEVLNE